MKRKTVCIIQARIGSTRLPGKVLLDLEGKNVLERVIERVIKSKFISDVIVATTTAREDQKIVRLCSAIGIKSYCGSENDVLDRYFQAARLSEASQIVRVTSDCPLIDPGIVDKVIKTHLSSGADYTSNTIVETFPDGEDVEIFTFNALKKAWDGAKALSDREHVTPFIRKNPKLFKLVNVENSIDLSGKRWTLDEKNDYKLIKTIYKYLSDKAEYFTMKDVLTLLAKYPELERLNYGIKRNEGYLKSLKKDRASV